MSVPTAFAVIGGVILIGFFANLLFRVTKIPSVLLLIAIGVILGPATGWISSTSLIDVAPFFGTIALLIILFEGGLELDIQSVLSQAPKAAVLAALVFIFSAGFVFGFAFFVLHLPLTTSLLMAGIFSASSPAICLPVVSGLSVNKGLQTILKLESALGDVLLIVSVLLVLDLQMVGSPSSPGVISRFLMSFIVAFVIASIAGALWSRLIAWMRGEPLAYMLTLGFVFLLYFSVEELGGNAAIAVLLFGFMLENMHVVAGHVSARMQNLFGIDVRAEQFVLHEFMKNITEELSFLIRTFFFVYLGLILNFGNLTLRIALSSVGIMLLLLAGRWVGVQTIRKRSRFTAGETRIALFMLPRGLATAVMAFLPAQYGVSGTEFLPTYAFGVIVLTNVLMTGGVIFAERRLARERGVASSGSGMVRPTTTDETPDTKTPADFQGKISPANLAESIPEGGSPASPALSVSSPAAPFSFANSMFLLFGMRPQDREWRCIEAMKASSLLQPQFWIMLFLSSALTILGLVLNQSAIIIGAALLVPLAWPVVAAGLALTMGDIYLFLKLIVKLAFAAALTIALAASFSGLLPFGAFTAEIASRTKATILDFLVAFFAGMAGATLLFSKRRTLLFLPGAILGMTLLPPLAIMGFGLGNDLNREIFRGGAILFTANFFAAILGASLVYALVGMPAIAGLEVIRSWKQRELSHPIVNLMFKRLRLTNLAGRTGSVRSRLVVAAVFLLALVIPLQMAFNQLSLEFRARQAITDVERMFELPGRSAIINSSSTIGADSVAVRIQVATNAFFSASDIRRFEERISDRTGKPARLDLVQSLSDVGEGEKIRGMLRESPPPPVEYHATVPEMTVALRDEVEKNLDAVPIPESISILGISAELGLSRQPSNFRIEYLAQAPLSEDAIALLTNLLEARMKLSAGSLRFIHVPSKYSFRFNFKGEISPADRVQLQEAQHTMSLRPEVHAQVILPDSAGEKGTENIRKELFPSIPLQPNPARIEFASDHGQEPGTGTVLLLVATSAKDKPR
jgi:cell volume regulation protein A